jgi:tRNA pseudouridine38-40 synthase
MERRLRIDLAYDGTAYAGWQLQPRSATVQGVVEEALARLHGGRLVRVRGAGRTDSGAHARGQVADALVAGRGDDAALLKALTGMLPDDVRPKRVLTVPLAFHARHDAKAKTYRYLIDTSATGDPWRRRYALAWPHPIDDGALDASLALLPGTRDWSGFTGSACVVLDRVRTITGARRVRLRPGLEALVFTADGFLTHMVRNLVGTLLEVARGRIGPERIVEILETGDRRRAGPTVPARGLCLESVVYDDAFGGPSGDRPPSW